MKNGSRNRLADAIISVWGISYLVTALVKPGLVRNVWSWMSCVMMVSMGVLLFLGLVVDRWMFCRVLSVGGICGFVVLWTCVTVWSVPYVPGTAAVSVVFMGFIAAVAVSYKAVGVRR